MRIPTITQVSTQIDTISQQNELLTKFQQQISTQKKIQNSSDDPVLASQIKSISDYIESLQSYDNNGTLAQNRASLFESTIQSGVNIMSKVNELTQNAKTDTLNNNDRVNLANELSSYLTRLVNTANTQDGNGNYIYSGSNTNSPPFVSINGVYQYQGGLDSVNINIAPNVTSIYNDSGFSAFGDIPTGNGSFTVTQNPSNTGTAFTSPGTIVSNASYIADTYTLSFVTNSAGKLAYQVVGANSGQLIPVPPDTSPTDAPTYTQDLNINFNGVNLNVAGQPNVGDSFEVAPSSKQNVFNSLQQLITTLRTPVYTAEDKAKFNQSITQTSEALLQASSHFQSYLSTVGSRAAAVDNQVNTNIQTTTEQNIILGTISNIDPYQVISEFSQQKMTFELTEQVYMKIQDTLNEFMKMQ
ncbi:MAG: flagellar hook-associated protein FlgL [Gammaproteobacteria bacterium]|nr:flagellar hook-associated protein FlgL [Gammaproteobacteria bacterium]